MWIKCENEGVSTPDNHHQIQVNHFLFNAVGETVWLYFGQSKLQVNVIEHNVENEIETNFDQPARIFCSSSVIDALFLQQTNVYQINFRKGIIEIGPVIGLLLGEQQYYYHQSTMGEYTDALSAYKQFGGLVYAFKTCSIDWKNQCVYGLYFDHCVRAWKYSKFPLPNVVYRRAFNIPESFMNKLEEAVKGKVFNSRRYSKWQLYKKLEKESGLKQYLPETQKFTSTGLVKDFLSKYHDIILKPIGLSRGRGICILQKRNKVILIKDYHDGTKLTEVSLSLDNALQYVKGRQLIEKSYIIQPYIQLAKINGAPWDIRVVMQKNYKKEWACHGIECRVAGIDDLVTNISRGGRATTLSEAIKLSFGPMSILKNIKRELVNICTLIAELLESDGVRIAELGIDIAMDTNQNFWIIESNVRPTFNGFKRHMDYNNYLHLCAVPIMYASSVAGFVRGGKDEAKA